MSFDFSAAFVYWPELLNGAINSVYIVVLAVVIGFVLGMLLAIAYRYGNRLIRGVVHIYVEIFRTTPALLQLMYVYLVLPAVAGINLGPITAAWITLGLNTAAFFSEILKAGFQSVDCFVSGESAAARN